MATLLENIKTAITNLSLDEPVNVVYGVNSEQNIFVSDTEKTGIYVGILPIVNNYNHQRNNIFTNTYNVSLFWGKFASFEDKMEDREPVLETLSTYARQHVVELEKLIASGLRNGDTISGSLVADFNVFDDNLDGVLNTFEVTIQEKIAC